MLKNSYISPIFSLALFPDEILFILSALMIFPSCDTLCDILPQTEEVMVVPVLRDFMLEDMCWYIPSFAQETNPVSQI